MQCAILWVSCFALVFAQNATWSNPTEYADDAECVENTQCKCSDLQDIDKDTACVAACNNEACGYQSVAGASIGACWCQRDAAPPPFTVNVTGWGKCAGNKTIADFPRIEPGVGDECEFTCRNSSGFGQNPFTYNPATQEWERGNITYCDAGAGTTNTIRTMLCAQNCAVDMLNGADFQPPRAVDNTTKNYTVAWTCAPTAENAAQTYFGNGCNYTCPDKYEDGTLTHFVTPPMTEATPPTRCGCYSMDGSCNSTDGKSFTALAGGSAYPFCLEPCDVADLDVLPVPKDAAGSEWFQADNWVKQLTGCSMDTPAAYGSTCTAANVVPVLTNGTDANATWNAPGTVKNYTAVCSASKKWVVTVDYETKCSAPTPVPQGGSYTPTPNPADPTGFTLACHEPFWTVGGGCTSVSCEADSVPSTPTNTTGDATFGYRYYAPKPVGPFPTCYRGCDNDLLATAFGDQLKDAKGCSNANANGTLPQGQQCTLECAPDYTPSGDYTTLGPYCGLDGNFTLMSTGTGSTPGKANIWNGVAADSLPHCKKNEGPTPSPPTPGPMNCTFASALSLVVNTTVAMQPYELAWLENVEGVPGWVYATSCYELDIGNTSSQVLIDGPIQVICNAEDDFALADAANSQFTCDTTTGRFKAPLPSCVKVAKSCPAVEEENAKFTGCEASPNGTFCQTLKCVDASTFPVFTVDNGQYKVPQCINGNWDLPSDCAGQCTECDHIAKCGGMCSEDCSNPSCGLNCEQPTLSVELIPSRVQAKVTVTGGSSISHSTWIGLYKANDKTAESWIAAAPLTSSPEFQASGGALSFAEDTPMTVEFDLAKLISEGLYKESDGDLTTQVLADFDTNAAPIPTPATGNSLCGQIVPPTPPPPPPTPPGEEGVKSFWRVLAIVFLIGFLIALIVVIILIRKMTSDRASYKELA